MALRIVVLGMGGRGRSWLRVVQQEHNVELAAIVDPDPARLARAAADFHVPQSSCFSTLAEAVAKTSPDAALIVTPNVLHEEHLHECLDRGLHILCEKPLVMHREAGCDILAKATQKGLAVIAVQNYRWNPGILTLRQLIAEGAVGEPTSCLVDFHRLRPIHGMPYPLLYNQAIHHLDAARWIFGCNAVSVIARSWNPPWHDCDGDTMIEATYEMENGVIFHYSGNYATRGEDTPYSGIWRIECAQGSISFMGDAEVHVTIRRREKPPEEVPPVAAGRSGDSHLLASLVAAVQHNEPAPTAVQDNLHSLEMIWSATESDKTGRKVNLSRFSAQLPLN